VDRQAGELRKQDVKVALQEQPFQNPADVAGAPGKGRHRDELQKRIWPTDTFVISSKVFTTPSSVCASTWPIRPKRHGTSRLCPGKVIVSSAALKPAHHASSRWPSYAGKRLRDPEQDYFADGMTEALITSLAKIGRSV